MVAACRNFSRLLRRGSAADGPVYSPGNRLALNGKLAATLGSPVVMVLDANASAPADLVSRALICKKVIEDSRGQVTGLILNQVHPFHQ